MKNNSASGHLKYSWNAMFHYWKKKILIVKSAGSAVNFSGAQELKTI